jgi:hypothetical protein
MSNDADDAARARVDTVIDRLRRVDLQVVVVAPPDATRRAARDRARAAAEAAGRGDLLDEASMATREATLRAFARAGFSGTWAATEMSASVASAGDRVAAAAAFEEAAMAAVVEDLVDSETLEDLRATSDELGRSTGMPPPGALSTLTSRAGATAQGPLQVAVLVASVIIAIAVWVVVGPAFGIAAFVLGAAVNAWLARRGVGRNP